MRKGTLITLLAILAVLAAACVAVPTAAPEQAAVQPAPVNPPAAAPAGADKLADTSWNLATLAGQPALKDTTVTLAFENGRVSGSDGCNRYSTSYTADGANVQIHQPMASTMMACPEPIMNQAAAYAKALEQTTTHKIADTGLTLFDAGGAALATFKAQNTDLAGTAWQVLSYNNGKQAVVGVINGTTLTANFGTDDRLSGNAGCNNFTAGYTSDGRAAITIGPAAATMMMCTEPQGIMEQEQQYLAALATAATYRIDGGKLELRTADGALAATFKAQNTDLAGTAWQVLSYNNGKQAVVSVINGTTLTANFGTDDRLSGNAGCNNFTAGYTSDGRAAITIGPAAATMMMCTEPQGIMEQEQQYLAALATAATYRIDGGNLELRTADGALAATFKAQNTDLAGTAWQVLSYNNGKQAVVGVINGVTLTANFGTDGMLTGNAGCNRYTAQYKIAGQAITIGPAASTRMFCAEPEGLMEQEQQYLAALSTAATYRMDGGKLELRTADGALAAQFTAAAASASSGG